jgi:hypothetical protein
MRRSREPGKSILPPPRHRAHPSRPAWGLPLRCKLPLLLGTRDRRKYSRHSSYSCKKDHALRFAIRNRHTSPGRRSDAGPRLHRECHLPLREPRLRRNSDRPPRLDWRQPELISRSLFRGHSRMPRQIALMKPPVKNLIMRIPEQLQRT